ncbi:MAG: polyisoprenoid-binding protein [Legionella longbeachae]|nr:polyisoprenoid-binding protein [Legionella longbeachae]
MKKYSFRILILLSLIFPFIVQALPITYILDPDHSYVLWHINHFNFSHPSGKWMAEGTVVIDKDQPKNSKVTATIRVDHMITGLSELDKHLKGELFFNTNKYPTATFVSDKISITSKTSAKVHGILTLRGVSQPVTLNVKLNSIGISPITNKETVGFSASTTVKRSDFGMTALLPGLGDTVNLEIEAEAYKK